MIIERQMTIAAPIDEVYRITRDEASRRLWDPFTDRIELLDGATAIGVGVRERVFAKSGLKMDVRYVQLDAPNRAAMVMTSGPFVLEKFGGSWIFHGAEDGATRVIFRYLVQVKWWAIPAIGGRLAGWYFSNAIAGRLAGLKRYCEGS